MWSKRPSTLKAAAEQAAVHGNLGAFIREFLDEFYGLVDSHARLQALAEEPPVLNHPTGDAYLAAVAEHLSFTNRLDPPAWTQDESRFLRQPFFPAGLESLKALCIKESPTAFRRRMIFVDSDPLSRPSRRRTEAGADAS